MKKNLPKISIITPSLNQGKFIEATINSVLSQKYPHLEYLIIDGCSTDNTLNVLKKYTKHLIWISEKDNGQSDAINKGLKKSTGEIVTYLNADDLLSPCALWKVGEYFQSHKSTMWLTGRCRVIDEKGNTIRNFATFWKEFWIYTLLVNSDFMRKKILVILNFISQPATFWRRELFLKAGFFDEGLRFVMDYDYWLRLYQLTQLDIIRDQLALFRIHPESKTSKTYEKLVNESVAVAKRYTRNKIVIALNYYHSFFAKLAFACGL
ncbi:hypothetical protein A3D77_07310 [Candidatus Gottesmanbacteria bacterium RIFCSPHIGHO2_02_FULL_39_11]|uniref:Glycosyltransferase 2-like domain-containing protein n=1 Tax=Candidatus Gottesmanbacteria bacterium RIFCSPHIGHO2_02_FULL_39_11 TaxID=1798382 RepID=A0A1F5ZL60_9BACT|nr:MAG: hypothetical protein A3D77_07310 [Candidatus Gottesmanbacteria bacterium RIFCSPHIGHO2_02_FULL_39_11]